MFDVSSERVQASYANSGDYPYRKVCPKPLFGLESFVRHRRIIALSGALFLALGLLFIAVGRTRTRHRPNC